MISIYARDSLSAQFWRFKKLFVWNFQKSKVSSVFAYSRVSNVTRLHPRDPSSSSSPNIWFQLNSWNDNLRLRYSRWEKKSQFSFHSVNCCLFTEKSFFNLHSNVSHRPKVRRATECWIVHHFPQTSWIAYEQNCHDLTTCLMAGIRKFHFISFSVSFADLFALLNVL